MDIVARAKGLITRPREEWQAIAREPSDTAGLFKGYVIPVSAIPVVAGFVGAAIFARTFAAALPGFSIGGLLVQSVLSYVLGLAGVWVFGKIVQALAPRFGGTGEEAAAMKLAAYSPTAMWLAGVFALVPPLSILTLLGLYSLYILYKGAPVVTGVPEDKALVFTLALVVCGIVINLLVIFVVSSLLLF
jgi:Yip1-like protein